MAAFTSLTMPFFNTFRNCPGSLERDVFPRLLDQGVYAQEQHGMFIDIGTPADYLRAQQLCDSLNEAASGGRLSGSVAEN